MSDEEVVYKLIELYYKNKEAFNSYSVNLIKLIEIYKDALEILKGENNE